MKYIFVVLLASILIISGCTTGTTTDGTLQIKSKELPQWISGGTATYKPEVTGGNPPYNFSIGDGTSLPSGFNMGPDGTIGGGGTLAPGSSKSISPPFVFVVTDSAGNTAEISYTIVITEPPIGIFPQRVTCTVNQRCNEVIATATRGNPPYTFQSDTFREGAPPFGTIIDVNGRLTGIPTQTGEYTVGVCVKDTVANSECGHATVIITEENTAVEQARPTIYLSTDELIFYAHEDLNPLSKSFRVANRGSSISNLNYTISVDAVSRVAVSPSTCTLPTSGDSNTISVSVNVVGLKVGGYKGTITVSDPAATNDPQKVTVKLIISPESTSTPAPPPDVTSTQTSFAITSASCQLTKYVGQYDNEYTVYVTGTASGPEGARLVLPGLSGYISHSWTNSWGDKKSQIVDRLPGDPEYTDWTSTLVVGGGTKTVSGYVTVGDSKVSDSKVVTCQ